MPNINDRKTLDATLPYYSYSINSEGTVQGGRHVSIRTFGWHLHVWQGQEHRRTGAA